MDIFPLLPLTEQQRILNSNLDRSSLTEQALLMFYKLNSVPEPKNYNIQEAISTIRYFNMNQDQSLLQQKDRQIYSSNVQQIAEFVNQIYADNQELKNKLSIFQQEKIELQKQILLLNSSIQLKNTPKTVPTLSSFIEASHRMSQICQQINQNAQNTQVKDIIMNFYLLFCNLYQNGRRMDDKGIDDSILQFKTQISVTF